MLDIDGAEDRLGVDGRVDIRQSWQRGEPLSAEALAGAAAEAREALGIPAVIMVDRDSEDADDDNLVEVDDWAVHLRFVDPIALEASIDWDADGVQFLGSGCDGPWDVAYLWMVRVAVALGMEPELPEHDDFVEEVRSWVAASVEDALAEAGVEAGEPSVEISTTESTVGAPRIEWSRRGADLVLELRGAGLDLRATVVGAAEPLSDEQLKALEGEDVRWRLIECVREQQGRVRPTSQPRFAGRVVLRVWEDGACRREEVLEDDALDPVVQALQEGPCDLTAYLADGTPFVRWADIELPAWPKTTEDLLSLCATWIWRPTAAEVEASFRATVANHSSHSSNVSQWLLGFSRCTGKLVGVTERRLMREAEFNGFDLDPEAEGPTILRALEAVSLSDGWEDVQSWLISGEWANDSTDEFIDDLVRMMGLPSAPTGLETADADEEPYIAAINAAAAANGQVERLYIVPDFAGTLLLIKLHPDAFAQLSSAGLLDAHEPRLPRRREAVH